MVNNSLAELYFAIASISTIAVAGVVLLCFLYILSILHDIKKLSKLAKKEAELIARNFEKGVGVLGSELSSEAAGFLRMVFTLLLSQFGKNTRGTRRGKIKSI